MYKASEALVAMQSRHIMEGDFRVSAQMSLIEKLKEGGSDTADAERFLAAFKAQDERYQLLRKCQKIF